MGALPDDQMKLEDWLDGELCEQDCDELRARLSRDPALAAELTRIQAERNARSSFWACCEPSGEQIDQLANLVRRDCLKHQVFQQRMHLFRNGVAVAATFALVFASGWMSRSRMVDPQGAANANNAGLAQNFAPSMLPSTPVDYSVPAVNPWQQQESQPYPTDSHGRSTLRPTYHLVLYSPTGVALQSSEFDDIRDSRKTSKAFSDLQDRLTNAQRSDTAVVNQYFQPHP